MNFYQAFETVLSYLTQQRNKRATRRLQEIAEHEEFLKFYTAKEIAKAEKIDEFFYVTKCSLGIIEYSTEHGLRTLSIENPEKKLFLVRCLEDSDSGFAMAEQMSYHEILEALDSINKLLDSIHTRPISKSYIRDGVWIENLDMLDTDYAAMLADMPRF